MKKLLLLLGVLFALASCSKQEVKESPGQDMVILSSQISHITSSGEIYLHGETRSGQVPLECRICGTNGWSIFVDPLMFVCNDCGYQIVPTLNEGNSTVSDDPTPKP